MITIGDNTAHTFRVKMNLGSTFRNQNIRAFCDCILRLLYVGSDVIFGNDFCSLKVWKVQKNGSYVRVISV